MSNSSSNHSGKASAWLSVLIDYWTQCVIANAQGETTPPYPTPEEISKSDLLRWPEVEKRTGTKRGHAHWMIREGRFPAPVKLPAARSESSEGTRDRFNRGQR